MKETIIQPNIAPMLLAMDSVFHKYIISSLPWLHEKEMRVVNGKMFKKLITFGHSLLTFAISLTFSTLTFAPSRIAAVMLAG